MDQFLEEQLERMRRLTERMSQAHNRLAENSELISRDRDALHGGPLHEVRDYRTHQTHDYAQPSRHAPRSGRDTARGTSSRRRRR